MPPFGSFCSENIYLSIFAKMGFYGESISIEHSRHGKSGKSSASRFAFSNFWGFSASTARLLDTFSMSGTLSLSPSFLRGKKLKANDQIYFRSKKTQQNEATSKVLGGFWVLIAKTRTNFCSFALIDLVNI